MSRFSHVRSQGGFTITELMVVMVIVAILGVAGYFLTITVRSGAGAKQFVDLVDTCFTEVSTRGQNARNYAGLTSTVLATSGQVCKGLYNADGTDLIVRSTSEPITVALGQNGGVDQNDILTFQATLPMNTCQATIELFLEKPSVAAIYVESAANTYVYNRHGRLNSGSLIGLPTTAVILAACTPATNTTETFNIRTYFHAG